MISYKIQKDPGALDVLLVPVFQDKGLVQTQKEFDKRFGGIFTKVLESKDFEGKKKQMNVVYTSDPEVPRVLLLGLGNEKDFSVKLFKQVMGIGVIAAQNKKAKSVGVILPSLIQNKLGAKKLGIELANAIEVAHYAFDEYKDEKSRITRFETFTLLGAFNASVKRSIEKGIEEGQVIADGVNLVRRLGNIPPAEMTPEQLAKEVEEVGASQKGLKVTILSKPEIQKLGMGCFLGVASGSQHEPKFIIMEYSGADKKQKPTVLIGKGITFDSGGLSIKPSDFMCEMKFDMLGAATVIGIMKVAAALGFKKNLVALVPACENMPGGTAYHPDDILRAMNGKTVEIRNTDAEGRLILADALCYAKKYKPKEVIDLATLTGACMVAIGTERNGLFSPEEKIANKLLEASESVGEDLWRLPLGEEYREAMKSDVADIVNISKGRFAGASTAAEFLKFFVDYPWAHIDLSGAYYKGNVRPWIRGGSTGVCLQTLIEYLRT